MEPAMDASTSALAPVLERAPASVEAPAAASSPPGQADDWAICCSGGGIRAASYCLGALQSLQAGGLLGRAKWIIGVSGGSYIAAARALVAADLDRASTEPPAYVPRSPEEQHLRRNAGHTAGGANIVLVGGLSLLGAVVMVVVVLAPLYAFSHAWGWLLNWQGVLTRPGPGLKMSASVTAPTWWVAPVVVAAFTAALFASLWGTFQSGIPGRWSSRASWAGKAVAVTAGLAVAMLVVPLLISWVYNTTGPIGSIVHFFAFIRNQYLSRAAIPGLIAVAAAVARSVKRELDRVDEPARLKAADGAPERSAGSKVASWALHRLLPWLASAVLIVIVAGAAVVWIAAGAAAGFGASQLWPVIAALAIMLLGRVAMDINGSSLRNLFRWRLAATYAVTRRAAQAWEPRDRQQEFAEAARTRLSNLSGDRDRPTLVIGSTADINANREVASGRGGFSLAFATDRVVLRADPRSVLLGARVGTPDVEAETADYEHLLGHTRFTLSDVIAISGTPLSPHMRAMASRSAYRLLLILTNMRLGAWVPHPAIVRRAREFLNTPPEERMRDSWWTRQNWLLMLWYMSQHPFGHSNPQKQEHRQAQLWAHVLQLREHSTDAKRLAGALTRLRAALCWRVMQPTLGMLWAELVGRTSYRATWIKVSDGDHYDDLGLVEALHRGAGNIVVLDASGDHPGTWLTVGRAVSLARSTGYEINLDPVTVPASDDGPRPSRPPCDGGHGCCSPPCNADQGPRWVHGTFTRQWADVDQPQQGHIWVCKLAWSNSALWDIQPGPDEQTHETTPSQLYDSADFEPYQRLGASTILAAAEDGRLPLFRRSSQ